MEQTYYVSPGILPESKMSSLQPRPQGDGMDSETLKIQELIPSSGLNTPSRRHHNLSFSHKTTSVSKNHKPNFVPHEPVKGAVKHVPNMNPKCGTVSLEKHTIFPKNSNITQLGMKTPAFGKTEKVQKSQKKGHGMSNLKDTVMTIQVPFYNAPSHLSQNTYQMIQNQNKTRDNKKEKLPTPTKASELGEDVNKLKNVETGNNAAHPPGSSEALVIDMQNILRDEREVEGDNRTASMADLEKLNDEINELRHELEHQVKVNGDLKKLLVASMGDDLHYKVERLVQDKAQLTQEVGDYNRKLYQDYEDLDKLSIQADMWRSKFKASRLMAEELSRKNSSLVQHCQNSHQAMHRLLQERQQMKIWMAEIHRELHQVRTAFDPRHAYRPMKTGPDTLLSLTLANQGLAKDVKFKLLGPAKPAGEDWAVGTIDALSPAEAYAYHVLSSELPIGPGGTGRILDQPPNICSLPYTVDKINRFHPDTKEDNLTINCCSKCHGEISVV